MLIKIRHHDFGVSLNDKFAGDIHENKILLGDFNAVIDNDLDHSKTGVHNLWPSRCS